MHSLRSMTGSFGRFPFFVAPTKGFYGRFLNDNHSLLSKTTSQHFLLTVTPPPSSDSSSDNRSYKGIGKGLGISVVSALFTAGVIFGYEWQKKIAKDKARIDEYLDMLEKYSILGPTGDASKGEIQIVTDPVKILEIEKAKNQKIGILARTSYQIWFCDAVIFPDGSEGFYTRVLWLQALKGVSGAAVLPILPDNKILLTLMFRHATREWEIAIPRGNGSGEELVNQIVKRELKEETGAEISSSKPLMSNFHADSGLTTGIVSLVKVAISKFGSTDRDPAEISMKLLALTREEIKKHIRQGYIEVKINGETQKIKFCLDSFTLAALYLDEVLADDEQESELPAIQVLEKAYV